MTKLLTDSEMATWCQTPLETIESDPYATEVNDKLGSYAIFKAGGEAGTPPDWTADTVPIDVKMLMIRAVRRTYVNPDSEVSSSAGPVSSRVLDEAALAAAFTEADLTLLASKVDTGTGDLFVASIGGEIPQLPPTIYVIDDQQVNLGAEREWAIPFLDINDVGVQDADFA